MCNKDTIADERKGENITWLKASSQVGGSGMRFQFT